MAYRTDLDAAAARASALEKEVAKLAEQNERLQRADQVLRRYLELEDPELHFDSAYPFNGPRS